MSLSGRIENSEQFLDEWQKKTGATEETAPKKKLGKQKQLN